MKGIIARKEEFQAGRVVESLKLQQKEARVKSKLK